MKKSFLSKRYPCMVLLFLLCALNVHAVVPSCNKPKLAYFGGPVLANVKVVPVFYGPLVNAQVVQNMPQFYADITVSSFWSWLCEYDTPSQHIGPGTATAGYVISSVATVNKATSTTDAALQTLLVQQIQAGNLPAPNSNTVYMVHFPPFVTITGPAGTGTSCVQFCAYHNSFSSGSTVICYAVIMDEYSGGCADGCAGNPTALENETDIASHELVESVTDPYVGNDTQANYAYPCAWGDNNCGEIGDICEGGSAGDTITVSGRSWVVQEMWSNCQGKCTSSGPVPVAGNFVATTFQNTSLPVTLSISNASSFCHFHLYTITSNPNHGSLTGSSNNIVYHPVAGFTGHDSFQYIANGSLGTVNITVLPFVFTSTSVGVSGTNFTVCWDSAPGNKYYVLTNSTLSGPISSWATAGTTNATGTNTCYVLPGPATGKPKMFVVIKQ